MKALKTKRDISLCADIPHVFYGTEGETRTLKGINPADFESAASTNSATSASRGFVEEKTGLVNRFGVCRLRSASGFLWKWPLPGADGGDFL